MTDKNKVEIICDDIIDVILPCNPKLGDTVEIKGNVRIHQRIPICDWDLEFPKKE